MPRSCRLCPHGPGGAAAHTRPSGTAGPLGRAAGWAAGRGKSYKSGSMRKVRPAGVACEVPSRWTWDGRSTAVSPARLAAQQAQGPSSTLLLRLRQGGAKVPAHGFGTGRPSPEGLGRMG